MVNSTGNLCLAEPAPLASVAYPAKYQAYAKNVPKNVPKKRTVDRLEPEREMGGVTGKPSHWRQSPYSITQPLSLAI
jgi:hypothetical protein